MPAGILIREIERIVHRARRVRFGHVERGEIVPIVLDLGARRDGEAEVGEDLRQLFHHPAHRVDRSLGHLGGGQGQVEPFGCQPRFELGIAQRLALRRNRIGDPCPRALDQRTLRLTLFGRHRAERLEQGRDPALLAQCGNADRLQRIGIASRVDRSQRLVQLCVVTHAAPLNGTRKKRHPARGSASFDFKIPSIRREASFVKLRTGSA